MSHCQFVALDGDRRACRICGFALRSRHAPQQIHRRCPQGDPGPEKQPESLAAEVAAYCSSGQAGRSAAQIERRLAACRPCELFTGNNCRAMDVSCCRSRDWIWALVGFGAAPKDCPRGNWEK
jgi:hypothetical protein